MKTPKLALCVLLLAVFLLCVPGNMCFAKESASEPALVSLTTDEEQFIKDHPIVTLGVDPSFIPYEFFDDGEYKGIAADYIDLICKKTGLNMVVTSGLTWTQAYEQAVNKTLDVLPCVVKTKERSKYFLFSDPYLSFQRVIFVRKDSSVIKSFSDLAGKTVAVQKNSSHSGFLKEYRDISLSQYATVQEALEAVSMGKEVAFVGNLATTTYLIESTGITNLKYVDIDIHDDDQVYFAVRNDWPLLVGIINKGLAAITEEEKITIRNRWMGVENEVDYSRVWKIGGLVGGVILLVFVISVFWIIRLRKEVLFRERVQAELNIAKESAETANQVKSAFLARMSHEIRTPLNAITGFAYLAKKSDNSSTQLLYLDKITDASRSMLGIINDILDFSKIEAGKISIERISFGLDKVIQQVISTNYIRIEEQGISFSMERDPGIPSFFWGDPMRIEQVLTNLISNAAKFTSKGSVSLSIELIGKEDQLFDLEFSVADTGIGMSEAQIAQLFKPFEQADSSISRRFGGSGLGLSIVKTLVDLMGGSVSVKSEEGKGSTFTVRLRLEADQEKENEIKAMSLGQLFKNIRALLIDNDATNSYLIKKYLTSFGIDLDAVSAEEEAVGLIEKAARGNEITYNLIIIDHATPKDDGIECWKRLRLLPLYRENPKSMLLIPFNRQDLFDSLAGADIDLGATIPVIPSVIYDGIIEMFKTRVLDHHVPPLVHNSSKVSQPYRVLLVEDNKTNQFIARKILEQAGFAVSIAENGQEGYDSYAKDRDTIDIILMDLHMPVMNGYDSTELIRKLDKEIPIVAMTADAIAGVEDRCRSIGINSFVSKPFDPDTFISDIISIVSSPDRPPKAQRTGLSEEITNTSAQEPAAAGYISELENKGCPFLNVEAGLKLLGGNATLYHTVLREYRAENSDLAAELSSQIESGSFSEAAKTVHKVKGSSGNIGATSLFMTASKLQKALEDNSPEVGGLFDEFMSMFEQVMIYISKLD